MEREIIVESLDDTRRIGLALGQAMPREAICLFRGELAAGKTTLIKAICAGLGVDPDLVTSPTYTLANWYQGTWPVCHVDFYRLEDSEALQNLDQADWLNPDGPTFIEWPDVALPLLKGLPTLLFELEPVPGREASRRLKATADDALYQPLLAALS